MVSKPGRVWSNLYENLRTWGDSNILRRHLSSTRSPGFLWPWQLYIHHPDHQQIDNISYMQDVKIFIDIYLEPEPTLRIRRLEFF